MQNKNYYLLKQKNKLISLIIRDLTLYTLITSGSNKNLNKVYTCNKYTINSLIQSLFQCVNKFTICSILFNTFENEERLLQYDLMLK
jgi:hypothetical protein